jgi:hypothetical protein
VHYPLETGERGDERGYQRLLFQVVSQRNFFEIGNLVVERKIRQILECVCGTANCRSLAAGSYSCISISCPPRYIRKRLRVRTDVLGLLDGRLISDTLNKTIAPSVLFNIRLQDPF